MGRTSINAKDPKIEIATIGGILYCGGAKGALSMSLLWTVLWMCRELYSISIGMDPIFTNVELSIFWVTGAAACILSVLGILNRVGHIKYAGLHVGCFMQTCIALQLYVAGDVISSFAPAVSALWLFGAAMFFKGVMNADGACASRKCR